MKKVFLSIISLLAALMLPISVSAEENEKINVYLFYGNGCGYCEAAKKFFASIKEEYGEYYNLVEYEVWYVKENSNLMQNVASYFGEEVGGVPYIVIGETTFGGYSSEYDNDIKKAIKEEYENENYKDIVAKVKSGEVSSKNYDTFIVVGIFAVIIGGFGALVYFSRK